MKETTQSKRRRSVIHRLNVIDSKIDGRTYAFGKRLDTVENKINVLLIATVLFMAYRLGDFILFMFQK